MVAVSVVVGAAVAAAVVAAPAPVVGGGGGADAGLDFDGFDAMAVYDEFHLLNSSGLEPELRGTRETFELVHDDREREYVVFVPDNVVANPAVVVNLHAFICGPYIQMLLSGMDAVATESGEFVIAYPSGYRSFNAGARCCAPANQMGVDDVGFILKVVDDVVGRMHADPTRVYAMGMSNGGYMSVAMSCEHSSVFAAIGIVAGANPHRESMVDICNFARPVPLIGFHGTEDSAVPYQRFENTVDDFLTLNACTDRGVVSFSGEDTECISYTECAPQVDGTPTNVTACTSYGARHYYWPGSPIIPPWGVDDVATSREIWAFFKQYRV